jgi:hypothetical protein
MSKKVKSVKIEFADVHSWWDYFVYEEIDGSDTVVGFIKEDKDGVQFVVGQDEATYNFKSLEAATNFAGSGVW